VKGKEKGAGFKSFIRYSLAEKKKIDRWGKEGLSRKALWEPRKRGIRSRTEFLPESLDTKLLAMSVSARKGKNSLREGQV